LNLDVKGSPVVSVLLKAPEEVILISTIFSFVLGGIGEQA
jgi:hypothetical protein